MNYKKKKEVVFEIVHQFSKLYENVKKLFTHCTMHGSDYHLFTTLYFFAW